MDVGPVATPPPVALLVVPNGDHDPAPLVAAIERHHPGWTIRELWCGDPQLRPCGRQWYDADVLGGSAWERRLVSGDAHDAEWYAAVSAVAELLRAGARCVVVLWVGSVAALGPIDALADPAIDVGVVVPRVLVAPVADGLAPTAVDLVAAGRYSTWIVSFGRGSEAALEWLRTNLEDGCGESGVGAWVQAAADLFGFTVHADDRYGAGPWRWPHVPDPVLLDVPNYDPQRPWVLDATLDRPARIGLVDDDRKLAVMAGAADQLTGSRRPLRLPGGVVVDGTIRSLVQSHPSCPAPWNEAADFRRWLEQRYWLALHGRRRDLAAAFPEPLHASEQIFDRWCRDAFLYDHVPFLVRHRPAGNRSVAVAAELDHQGLNLVGYLKRDFSLGDVGRRLRNALAAANVPASVIAHHRSDSPKLIDAPVTDQTVRHTTTLAVVNADQFAALQMDMPELFAATERMIGYWFWELEQVPRTMRRAIALVDEIWTGSRFVAGAFAAVAGVPVRHVPIPVPAPQPSSLGRGDFAPLATAGQRPLFLVTFDHFSITERKNPIGAIRAFIQAFRPNEGPVLVVKSMNGSTRWPHHQKVTAAAAGRPDIIIWDEHLSRADQMALVASADCLVSLHRSEGLGLHLAEAMWLGTPTIATRYGGNLDFMDDACALLVEATQVHVTDGQGIYPPSAWWADPDRDQAAEAMRRIASDGALGRRLADAALTTMHQQPSPAETGRLIARLLHEGD